MAAARRQTSPHRGGPEAVLVIAPTPFFADRGCHVRIYEEVKLLQEIGYHVEVCTYHHGRDLPGISTRRTPTFRWYTKLGPGPSYHKFYVDIFLLWEAFRAVRKLRPVMIHAHLHEGAVIGGILGKLCRIPCIADLQGSLTKELSDYRFAGRNRLVYRLFRGIEKWIDHLPDHILVSSEMLAEDLVHRFGLRSDGITVARDGVGRSFFEQGDGDPRAGLGIPEHHKVVVFMGVLTRLQGVEILMETIPQVLAARDDVTFLVIGFPREQEFRARLEKAGLGGRAIFAGRVDYLRVARLLATADLAVSPKISETEGNGKLYNYMACGLPTVVFESGINREILGELGIYVPEKSARAFARGILDALANESLLEELRPKLRRKAQEECSWDLNRELLRETYGRARRRAGEAMGEA
jgi:glycosyltransferase involved in cell wall biosynthesis